MSETKRTREFVLAIGDETSESHETPRISTHATAEELFVEVSVWLEDVLDDAAGEPAEPEILRLLRAGEITRAADLFCLASGRWWRRYHPDWGYDFQEEERRTPEVRRPGNGGLECVGRGGPADTVRD
ncbi:MAG: hypothetical protein JWO31_2836 [Phycisphaerales bacterium]|nr:hypothetical protein [Phycisphaerales bacterium]